MIRFIELFLSRNRRWVLPVNLLLLFATSTAAQIYVNSSNDNLYRYDVASCSYEFVVELQYPLLSDISFHPNGNLYCITEFGQLAEIDTLDGSLSVVHSFPFDLNTVSPLYAALTIDANGVAYTAGLSNQIRTYDFSTGTETLLGTTDFFAAGDLTFYQGELYMSTTSDEIVKINLDDPPSSSAVINASPLNRLFGLITDQQDCDEANTYLISNVGQFAETASIYNVDFENNNITFACFSDIGFLGAAARTEYLASIVPLSILENYIENTSCGEDNGLVMVEANGSGPILYSLDGEIFQTDNTFEDLAAGTYTIYIMDDLGCMVSEEFEIENSEATALEIVETIAATCGDDNGYIEVLLNSDLALYSINGSDFLVANFFDSLAAGEYNVIAQNDLGCEVGVNIVKEQGSEDCKIKVPNIFTPDGDGLNDIFSVVAFPSFQGNISMKIFSRWGEEIFSRNNILVDEGWDGTKNGKKLPSDVFVYIIEVNNSGNDQREVFSGDVTLVR